MKPIFLGFGFDLFFILSLPNFDGNFEFGKWYAKNQKDCAPNSLLEQNLVRYLVLYSNNSPKANLSKFNTHLKNVD